MGVKLIKVRCKKTFIVVLNDNILEHNKKKLDNVDKYPLFVKGKIYKTYGKIPTISGCKILFIHSNLRHPIGEPDYSHWIDHMFYLKCTTKIKPNNIFKKYFEFID